MKVVRLALHMACALGVLTLLGALGYAERLVGVLEPSSSIVYQASASNGHTWEGTAPVTAVVMQFDDEAVAESLEFSITVDSADFRSGNFIRDANARASVFESRQFPTIRFTSRAVDLATLEQGRQEATVQGELQMHGVSRAITLGLVLDRSGDQLHIQATDFDVQLSDYAMHRPNSFGATVDDRVQIMLDVLLDLVAP